MAVSNTTRTSLDFALEYWLGPMDVAWRMPKLFSEIGGKAVIERVTPVMEGAGARKWMTWPIEFTADFPFAAGGGFGSSYSETGARATLYQKTITAIAEIEPQLQNTESGVQGMGKEADRKVKNIVQYGLPALGMHHFWLDGSGRRARIYSIAVEGSYTKIILKPLWAQDAWPGALDAAKYLVQNMQVDLTTCDETAGSGAGSYTRLAWGTGLRILTVHTGMTIHTGSDPSYIIVSPQVTDPGTPTLDDDTIYVSLTHPLGTMDGEPQGCARWIGNGYNARSSGIVSAVDAAHNPFGWRAYAGLDRADVAYEAFIGYIANMAKPSPTADITLTGAEVDTWLQNFYEKAPPDTDLDCFVANSYLRARFNTAFAAQQTLYLDNTHIRYLGTDWQGATIYDPYGVNGGRFKPLFFARDAWRQSIWGFQWAYFKQAVLTDFQWLPNGNAGSAYWTDLRPITKEPILRAVGQKDGFLIQGRPAAQTAMLFVTE